VCSGSDVPSPCPPMYTWRRKSSAEGPRPAAGPRWFGRRSHEAAAAAATAVAEEEAQPVSARDTEAEAAGGEAKRQATRQQQQQRAAPVAATSREETRRGEGPGAASRVRQRSLPKRPPRHCTRPRSPPSSATGIARKH